MTYGTKCWLIKKKHIYKMNVEEMRILRWMCGETRKDNIKIEGF